MPWCSWECIFLPLFGTQTKGKKYSKKSWPHFFRQDPTHLWRALKFMEFSEKEAEKLLLKPDNPWSLFEGVAGTVWFLCDLRDLNPQFPAFDL